MNRFVMVIFLLTLVGCAHKGGQSLGTYFEEPQTLIQDPHFSSYKESLDSLESDYLRKKFTYAEYLKQKESLDAKYAREVKHREKMMSADMDSK